MIMDAAEHLSKRDVVNLLEIIHSTLSCDKEEDFKGLVLRMHDLIEFECAFADYANIEDTACREDALHNDSGLVVNVSFPSEYLERYVSKGYHLCDGVAIEMLSTFEIRNWKEVEKKHPSGVVELEAAEFGLKDGFSYGVKSLDCMSGSGFTFAVPSVENNDRTKTIIQYAVPHLTEVMKRLLRQKKAETDFSLTPRELEVLKWLSHGKSSWDISVILGISEDTVNFHAGNIIRKLNAMNRTHAVAIALSNGLIDM